MSARRKYCLFAVGVVAAFLVLVFEKWNSFPKHTTGQLIAISDALSYSVINNGVPVGIKGVVDDLNFANTLGGGSFLNRGAYWSGANTIVDFWGNQYMYAIVGTNSGSVHIRIWSKGENERDDGGEADDMAVTNAIPLALIRK